MLSSSNCHPFRRGSLMWMHNGNIGGWEVVKQALAFSVSRKWFNAVEGSTDSEWAFALFLDVMMKNGHDPDGNVPDGGFGHVVLRKAMLQTIKRINKLIADIPGDGHEDLDTRSLLNFAVADGHTVVCTRYVSSATDQAASLYFSSGTSWKEDGRKGNYKMERRDKGADIVLVASEPLTFERGKLSPSEFYLSNVLFYPIYCRNERSRPVNSFISPAPTPFLSFPSLLKLNNATDNWVTVPTNSTLTIHKQTVMIHPIIDQYYNYNPSHVRSSGFVVSQGLVSGAAGDGAEVDGKEDASELATREGESKEIVPLIGLSRARPGELVVGKKLVNGTNGR